MVIEWLKDERGELYVGAYNGKLYANGIVKASVKLNSKAYARLKAQAEHSKKLFGKAII